MADSKNPNSSSEISESRISMTDRHIPVLLEEAVSALNIRSGYSYVDGTFGAGGHAERILEEINKFAGRPAKLYLIDKDKEAIDVGRKRFSGSDVCSFHVGSFGSIDEFVSGAEGKIGGVLLDLGISSTQVDDPNRGFSFSKSGVLDMRMGQTGVTAAEIVNEADRVVLFNIIRNLGEERFAGRIADAIIRRRKLRPIVTTVELAEIVGDAIPKKFHGRINPATKTFMALRIAVNDELNELERGLESALRVLAPTGRLAVITFHSLEDRIVKEFIRDAARGCICPFDQPVCTCGEQPKMRQISKKPIVPDLEEIKINPRARSAKMRVAEKC